MIYFNDIYTRNHLEPLAINQISSIIPAINNNSESRFTVIYYGAMEGEMAVWISAGRGIRYKEHKSRKHGQRPDRYWAIRYQLGGRTVSEAVGWWSQGVTQAWCEELLTDLRRNHRLGQGPRTLKESRQIKGESQAAKAAAEESRQAGQITLSEFMPEHLDRLRLTVNPQTAVCTINMLNKWFSLLNSKCLSEISTEDLEMLVVKPMMEAGKSPGSIERALAGFSSLWNDARQRGIVSGPNPKSKARRPRVDNHRERFLSKDEAVRLLNTLKERSLATHDMALLSLFCGLRASECLRLTWADVDFDSGLLFVKNGKSKISRHAFMTDEVRTMLGRRFNGQVNSELVLIDASYKTSAHYYFCPVVRELGLNAGISDRRQKVCFHTFRHTFASWLVMMGKPLYTVSKLLGHTSLKHTQRYAHLAPDAQRAAARQLDGFLNAVK